MKQHITKEQWQELNEKQQLVLARKFDIGVEKPEFYVGNPNVYIPLSIGQMIEFLDNQKERVDIFSPSPTDKTLDTWVVVIMSGKYCDDELCDALWEAVKEVLNDR